MVDKLAHATSAAHMSAVKAMGFSWLISTECEKVRVCAAGFFRREWACTRANVCVPVCAWNRFLMPVCLSNFSSEKTLMVLETNELEYRISITISILAGPWTVQRPLGFSIQHHRQALGSLRQQLFLTVWSSVTSLQGWNYNALKT